jgi:peptidoglycan/xylan/chitin deacetylase (PgdA/CDA1 family)
MHPRVKNVLKRAVKGAGRAAGFFLHTRVPCARILTYHSVGYRAHEMNVTPEMFQAQMTWLAKHAAIISLCDAADGKPGVALTFDDGYRDNLVYAAPGLKELGLPAPVFMVAGKAGEVLVPEEAPDTGSLMTWDDLKAIESFGVEAGAHGMTHRRLSELTEEEQAWEIGESKRLIEAKLEHPVRFFAYPYGSSLDYSEITFGLVRKAGFRYAFSNRYGVVIPGMFPWELRRIWIDATDSLASFQAKVDGRLDLLRVLDAPAAIRWRRRLNRAITHENSAAKG